MDEYVELGYLAIIGLERTFNLCELNELRTMNTLF